MVAKNSICSVLNVGKEDAKVDLFQKLEYFDKFNLKDRHYLYWHIDESKPLFLTLWLAWQTQIEVEIQCQANLELIVNWRSKKHWFLPTSFTLQNVLEIKAIQLETVDSCKTWLAWQMLLKIGEISKSPCIKERFKEC